MAYKKVKIIENSSLNLTEKVELLLVYGNLKPAGYFFHIAENENTTDFSNREIKNYQKLFSLLKLHYKTGQTTYITNDECQNDGSYDSFTPFFFSRNRFLLEKLIVAYDNADDFELGMLNGYPKTAVEAYTEQRDLFYGSFVTDDNISFFTQFAFSSDYFNEECKQIQNTWYKYTKKRSPKLFNQI